MAPSDIVLSRRVFKTRHFAKWSSKAGLPDSSLCTAVEEMRRGLIDADLGGHVIKKRIPLPGRGKRGGARTLVATRMAGRWFFLTGFEKSAVANISPHELQPLCNWAADLLCLSTSQLDETVRNSYLTEICHEETQSNEQDTCGRA